MSDLSVIIVSYNVRRFLEQAILSIQKSIGDIEIEIIVVDNASSDDSSNIVREKYPQVKLIENKDNQGFSKANNQGIKISTGKYILLLNPDTVLAEDTLKKCYDFMENTPDCGALGVRMIDGSGTFLPESKRGLPTPKVSFYKIFGLASLFPKSKKFGAYHLKYLNEFETHPIDVLSGAFMFMRKEALDKSGLLDETFFMYGEDIDLSYRITLAGYKNYYFPETSIIHYKGESTKKNSLHYVRVFYQAMIIFAEKHFGVKSGKIFGQLIYLAVYLRAFAALLKRFVIKGFPVFVEYILLYLSYFAVTRYWEEYNKWVEGGAYPQEYFVYHLSAYSLILIIGLLLGGAYKRYFSGNNLWRGFFIASSLLVIFYAFLPETLRYSRAILLLGAFLGLSILAIYRSVLNFIKNQSFSLGSSKGKRILAVGKPHSIEKVREIVAGSSLHAEIIGSTIFSNDTNEITLSNYNDFYKIDEIVLCSGDLSNKQIIEWLCKPYFSGVEIKILPEGSNFIIGSSNKNKTGDFYSTEKILKLGSPGTLLNKRIFDIFSSIVIIPLMILTLNRKKKVWSNWLNVILGKKTWIGYNHSEDYAQLPAIKESVFELKESLAENHNLSSYFVKEMNQFYAQNYSWKTDLDLFGKCLFR
ncbi:MAG: glycosyltransferase [Bacteroidetes bacterium]|nr:glycosyltransferase [Bacteroidota bacterium]